VNGERGRSSVEGRMSCRMLWGSSGRVLLRSWWRGAAGEGGEVLVFSVHGSEEE
jgi:hypothetical protein